MGTTGQPSQGARALLRRLGLVLLLTAAPLAALVAALGVRAYGAAVEDELGHRLEEQAVRRQGIEQLAAAVELHVATMRDLLAVNLAAGPPPYAGPSDWPGSSRDPGPGRGVMLVPPGRADAGLRQEMAAMGPVFRLARAAQGNQPYLRWSYFFSDSRDLVAIYPWADPTDFIGAEAPETVFDGYFDYPLYRLALPGANPEGGPYWTPVYSDAGGTGLMVTHGAPVVVDGVFRGMVGADVVLGSWSAALAGAVAGTLLVVDQEGHLIADDAGRAADGDATLRAADLLGVEPPDDTGGTFVRVGDQRLSVAPVAGTPWHIVSAVGEAELSSAALARAAPHVLLLAGIVAAFGLMAALMQREFVRPAVALLAYGTEGADAAPRVPGPWRGLRDRLRTAERERRSTARRMRAMLDGLPLRAVYVGPDLRYRDANGEFLAFVGRPAEEVIGQSVEAVLGAPVAAEYRRLAPTIRRGEIARFEGWTDYPGGRRLVQVSVLPFTAEGESEPGFLTFTRDLTELRAQEEAARRSEARHRAVVESSLDAVVVMDDGGRVLDWNRAAEATFGYEAREAIGQRVSDLIVPEPLRAAHEAGMARYLAGGEARVLGRRVEIEGRRKDGTVFPVELTVTRVELAGRPVFASHLRDLSEPKRLEQEMAANRERLHQVEKLSAMGSLLAGVAHELNNPLAIVVAQSGLLVEKAGTEDVRRRGERIRAAAERCGRIVKSFLAMARRKPPERAPVSVNEVVQGNLDLLAYGMRASGVEVVADLAPGLPPVLGDRDLLGQVLGNLLVNAQQALAEVPGERRIRVATRAVGDKVEVEIADSGPGVPEALRERIFEPYFTTKPAGVGTGIGLAISRDVALAHGGTLSLLDGPGARFVLSLPATEGALAGAAQGPAQEAGGLSLVVVDDEPDVGESLAEMLRDRGHRVQVFENGTAALAHLGAEPVHGVFADLRMPGLDGATLALRIAAEHPGLARKVVIVSGDSVAGPARLAAAGAAPILLEKPFTPADVGRALEALAEA